jgi:phytoene synthase
MKALFDDVSSECSRITTRTYSTSFSMAILFLNKELRKHIYAIYGFVRFADEIVDSFHEYDKKELLSNYRSAANNAVRDKISLNPILNAFQATVHQYSIQQEWIDLFMNSMEMDLHKRDFTDHEYKKYILGSAEAVGLMCLHVFTNADKQLFEHLKPYAMKLGAAFQKVNFLRDIKADNVVLGRVYFPGTDITNFCIREKKKIEQEIEDDFREALKGIKLLPVSSRNGVYLGYHYYRTLFKKIRRLPPKKLLNERISIPNFEKIILLIQSNLRHQFNLL